LNSRNIEIYCNKNTTSFIIKHKQTNKRAMKSYYRGWGSGETVPHTFKLRFTVRLLYPGGGVSRH